VLDNDRTNHQAGILGGPALGRGQVLIIPLRQIIPGDALTQIDPSIVLIQRRLEWPVKPGQRQFFLTAVSNHKCTLLIEKGSFFVHYYTFIPPVIVILSMLYTL